MNRDNLSYLRNTFVMFFIDTPFRPPYRPYTNNHVTSRKVITDGRD
jgi:hypothetical protein